ncbi:hypothetical protein K470DRAFT_218402 [Piedraia hortae CBS 480.64]|uniref:Vacuolar import and degradation protein n=1 Tax=Piedraia hortae CBS 480.64 TaxID=1314780 RepID=A0A6A7BX98_9PEZI|nr:hypothetical protein K470DRAFT_218402 [Piedraia hortae CBS 480.64]
MSTIFRPDSEFKGMQRSERQNYDVNVSLKHVDMAASFVEGYLSIQGLTEDHPTLTTFFQGEIIGHGRYTFTDTARAWGSSEKNDLKHWQEFPGFNKSLLREKLKASDRYVFMRWKEFFLVPDHKVTKLNGASFEGFYYICFDQKERKIDGCYYHKKSARDQKLELRWVDDRGRTPAWEFC